MFELSLVFLNNLKWHGSFSFASCRCNLGCKPSLKSWRLKCFDQLEAWERSSLANERPGQPSESRVRCGSSGNIRPTREPFPELPGSWQWTIGRKMNCLHAHTQEGELYRMYIVLDCSSMSTNKILSMYRVCAFDWSINHSIFLLLFSLYPGGSCQTIIADIPRILDWPRLTRARRHNDSDSDTSVKCFITLCLINILGMSSANLTQSDVSSVKRAFMIKQNIATVKNRYLFICQKMLERQSLDIYQWLWQADTQWHAMTGRWWLSMLVPDHIRALSPAGSHAPWANSLRGFERSSRSANMCLQSSSGSLAVFEGQ